MELAQSLLSERFLRFSEKMNFLDLTAFLPFDAKTSCVFQIFFLRSIKAYWCPNIINFESVDFSERRPEDVISFF